MQQLVNSLIRFSTATALFGVQQIQNVIEGVSDPKAASKKLSDNLDVVTSAITGQLNEQKKSVIDSAAKLVEQTGDAIPKVDMQKLVDNVTDVVRKTADTLTDAINKSVAKDETTEPAPAAEALA